MADSFSAPAVTIQPESWLNRNVVGMALASFFSDAGHEMATAILPLFLASIGASPAALGVIEGVSDAVASFVKLVGGWYSDKIGRRKEIAVIGYALTGFSTGFFALAMQWWHILIARSVGWFGRGVRGPLRDAMLAESVPPETRGRAFGFHRAGDTTGAIVGPLFAFLLVSQLGFQEIFLITLVPGLLSAAAFFFFVTEKRRAPNAASLLGSLSALPRAFRLFLFGVGAFGAGNFAHSLLILRATQILTNNYGATMAGSIAIGLYTMHNVLYAGAAFPIGALADRIGKRTLLALGYLLFGVMSLGFILPSLNAFFLAILFAIAGIYIAAVDTLEGSMAADLLPDAVRGTGYGALAAVNGVGDFVSSFVVGIAWTLFSPAIGFGYAALMSILGAIIISRRDHHLSRALVDPFSFDVLHALDKSGCPICRVRAECLERFFFWLLTQDYADGTMPEELKQSGGLCPQHAQRLLDRPVVYQTSVMYQYLVSDAMKKLAALAERARKESRKPKRRPPRFHSKPMGECPACVEKREIEGRVCRALVRVLEEDAALDQYRKGDALCLPHFHCVIEHASPRVVVVLAEIQIGKLQTLACDFDEYFRKVDYRFADEPKGEEQTAWRRAIRRFVGEGE